MLKLFQEGGRRKTTHTLEGRLQWNEMKFYILYCDKYFQNRVKDLYRYEDSSYHTS